MGVSAFHRDVKKLSAQNVGGADTAADDGSPGAVGAGVRSLCAAQAEFHDAVAVGGIADPGGLGGDQTLMVDDIQDSGLYQLCLHDGSDNFDQRFPRKYHRTFRDRVNVSGELEIFQVVKEVLVKDAETCEVSDILIVEAQLFDILNQLL